MAVYALLAPDNMFAGNGGAAKQHRGAWPRARRAPAAGNDNMSMLLSASAINSSRSEKLNGD